MRYRRLDLNLLIALDALLVDQSVTRAAARLNITQPAMSGSLARLREYFEDPLVIQVGRHMELTPLAQSMVDPIHDVIMRIDSLIATEPDFDPSTTKRHFTISASDYVLRVFLQDVLARVHREAPGITFEFRQSAAKVQGELESGDLDFVIGPEAYLLPDHPHEFLFNDTYTLIAWEGSTVVGDSLSFDEYTALRHVAFRNEREGVAWFEHWFAGRYGAVRRIDLAVPSFALLPYLVVGTDRIATIQTRLARLAIQTLPLKLIPPPIELPILTEVMQWNVHRDPDPASRWLRSILREHAASFAPPTSLAAPGQSGAP
jgi:LysR family transcriptional regulator, nod-box dependent transcriptional activator